MQSHPLQGPTAQVDLAPPIPTGEVVIRFGTHTARVCMFADRHGVVAHAIQPVHDISAPVSTRRTGSAAHAQVHRSSCQKKIFGDLASGLTTAHHQDRTWG